MARSTATHNAVNLAPTYSLCGRKGAKYFTVHDVAITVVNVLKCGFTCATICAKHAFSITFNEQPEEARTLSLLEHKVRQLLPLACPSPYRFVAVFVVLAIMLTSSLGVLHAPRRSEQLMHDSFGQAVDPR